MQPHQQRVVDEASELRTKVEALTTFINTNKIFLDLEMTEQMLLEEQLEYMKGYLDVLNDRIARFQFNHAPINFGAIIPLGGIMNHMFNMPDRIASMMLQRLFNESLVTATRVKDSIHNHIFRMKF